MTEPGSVAITHYRSRINSFIDTYFNTLDTSPLNQYAPTLVEAMRYAVLNGGKRIRPLLVYASASAIIARPDDEILKTLDRAAAAVEFIHCYSLVHDDLPAMDDDDFRRGQPTCHKQFDEATAILVGDALQTAAFELLTTCSSDAKLCIALLQTLTQAAGIQGLIGGQAIDLAATNQAIQLAQLQTMHKMKTAAMIACSTRLGAQIAGASDTQLRQLEDYAQALGLAFQIQDDILDIESPSAVLGKVQGSDIANNKSTYPSMLGMTQAKALLDAQLNTVRHALQSLAPEHQLLHALTELIIHRRF